MWPRTPTPESLTNSRLDTRPPGPAAQSKSSPRTHSAATSLCPTQPRSYHSEKVMCKLTTCAPSIRRMWGRQHGPQTAAHPSSPRDSTTNSCATQQQRARVGSALPPNPTPHPHAPQPPNAPFPHAARRDVLVVGSHVLQHLDHREPALPSAA